MAFKDFPDQQQGIELLRRSLERGRLGHAYLFTGHQLEALEDLARTLAKTLNCSSPAKPGTVRTDSCDDCLSCRKIDHGTHPDVHFLRPESKSRIITVDQVREIMREIQLKPTEATYKVAVVVAADRMRTEAANAFLKTLEEPPAKSILILLSTEPQRLLDTILSRCLRLNFATESMRPLEPAQREWLEAFATTAAAERKSLLGRYQLLDALLRRLNQIKEAVEANLTARSPLQQYKDADKDYIERWEHELAASIEAEYRRQRADVLSVLEWWLRDVWIRTLLGTKPTAETGSGNEPEQLSSELLCFPDMPATAAVARRISPQEAQQNLQTLESLQRWLSTNVQEALALEVGLLKLRL
ncbi:MAG TPA: DNA polymerase III subunit [Verrucomicrobiae bacterium]|nr:DNA polymerase III subunit [Verrucomicrobiae bacterium]